MKKSEPLIVGIPTNEKLAEDLAPFTDSLELEGSQGRLTSPKFESAIFRPLRAQGIARFLCDGRASRMDVGIVGTDTMVEKMLANSVRTQCINQLVGDVFARPPVSEVEVGRIANIDTPPTRLEVLIREEDEEKLQKWAEGDADVWKEPSPAIVTSYPNIAQVFVFKALSDFVKRQIGEAGSNYSPCMSSVIEVRGQVESILRNSDIIIPKVCFGLDIIRSGKTVREFGLKTFGESVLVSRPGLWVKDAQYADKIPKNQLEDFMAFIRERFAAVGLNFTDLVKRNPLEEIEPWKSPFPLKPEKEKIRNYGRDVKAGNVTSEAQLDALESLIGRENVIAGKKLLRDGGVMWVFRSPEESESNLDLSDEEKRFCKKRFAEGEKYVGISRSQPRPRREYIPGITPMLGCDAHGNLIGGGTGRSKDSIH